MSLSNRTSLDTDVVFLRNIFMFSTNTNNVPVSTNFILAAGQYGQIGAVDTLRNIETYGVGYLPCTFSTFNGQMLSISSNVASSFVNSNQLFSVQNYLISSISSTNANLNAFSSYVINELVPSTVSGITWALSSLNSSFQGYVVGTSVTQSQLFSTTDGLILNTGNQISSYSTIDGTALTNLSNYLVTNGANNVAFSNLSTYVSTFAASTNFALISTGQNFTALSNYVRLNTASNSTYLAEISATVSELIDEVNLLSSIIIDPLYTIGVQSTLANVKFGSNIAISSINENIFMSNGGVGIGPGTQSFIDPNGLTVAGNTFMLGQAIINGAAVMSNTLGVAGTVTLSNTLRVAGAATMSNTATFSNFGNSNTTIIRGSGTNTAALYAATTNNSDENDLVKVSLSNTTSGLGWDMTMRNNTSLIGSENILEFQSYPANAIALALSSNGRASIGAYDDGGYTLRVHGTQRVESDLTVLGDINTYGRVGIGNIPPSYDLDVLGDINFTGNIFQNGNPFGGGGGGSNILGTLSIANQVFFGSNITISSINSNLYFSNTGLRIENNFAVGPTSNYLFVNTANSRVGISCNAPSYTADINGDLNFTGTLRSNGAPFSGAGSVNVLGTLSTVAAANTWFNSNINVSSINNNLYLSNGGLGIGTQTGIGANGLTVTGPTLLSNTLNVTGAVILSNNGTSLTLSNTTTSNATIFNIAGAGSDTLLLRTTDGISVAQNYPILVLSNSGNSTGLRIGLGNSSGAGGWTAGQVSFYSYGSATITQAIAISTGSGNIGIRGPADSSNALNVGASAFITSDLAVGSSAASQNVLFVNDTTNRVGINCNAPTSDLTVLGTGLVTSNFAAGINGANNVLYVDDANNRVGVNCNAPTLALDINGQTKMNDKLTVGTNILYVNPGATQVGINTASFGSETFKVAGTALITSNLIAGCNAATTAALLYVHDGSNSVGINTNTPNSAYVMDVNGVANFRSNISTTYTVQSAPRAWSYYNTGSNLFASPVVYTTSNYEATGIATPQTAGVYVTPYAGVYKISFSCETNLAAGTSLSMAISIASQGGVVRIQNSASGSSVNRHSIALTIIESCPVSDTISITYAFAGVALYSVPQLTIEYLG